MVGRVEKRILDEPCLVSPTLMTPFQVGHADIGAMASLTVHNANEADGQLPVAKQMRILQDETAPVAAAKPTYQVSKAAALQVQPGPGATVVRSLSAKTGLTVLESKNGWSLVASEGKPLGYVATQDLAPVP
jgi:hypothetical protein